LIFKIWGELSPWKCRENIAPSNSRFEMRQKGVMTSVAGRCRGCRHDSLVGHDGGSRQRSLAVVAVVSETFRRLWIGVSTGPVTAGA
jgi:hypothetical protein